MNKETRINSLDVSIRQAESGEQFIKGYGAVFNQRSRLIRENGKTFYEIILPGAFDKILKTTPNVIANVGHDDNKMLGRTRSGTLTLSVDEIGLHYKISVPNTALGRDTMEQIKRGDLDESSFKYGTLKNDISWGRAEDGIAIRYVKNISALWDVAIVRNGAFPNTDVALRQLAEFENSKENYIAIRMAEINKSIAKEPKKWDSVSRAKRMAEINKSI